MTKMLEKINKFREKKIKIIFSSGEEVICRPLQYLEEDYDSYLVEVVDGLSYFPNDELLEVEESEIKSIEEIIQ